MQTAGSTFALTFALGLVAPAAWAQAAAAGAASAPEFVEYRIAAGDTLAAIGQRLLETPADWRQVQSVNDIRDPRRLRIGALLRIPGPLLKSQPGEASLSVVTGGVLHNGQTASVGQKVTEAAVLATGADGIVEIRLGDGSTLRLTPNSRLRLERLRRFHRDDIIEARTVLEQGRVEAQASPQRRKPLEIRTPFATAAVRGTDFRVGTQPELVVAEVLGGSIDWSGTPASAPAVPARSGGAKRAATARAAGSPAAVSLAGGFGSSGDRQGRLVTEALLAAPDLGSVPATVDQARVRERFGAVADASSYRVQIFADAERQKMLQERVAGEPAIDFETADDGTLYLRVRAISGRSIEGMDRNGALQVRARPFAPRPEPAPNRGVVFEPRAAVRWQPSAGADAYQVQWATDEGFRQVIGERTVTGANAAELPLSPGDAARATRWWRVAGRNPSGGYLGPFSAPQALNFYAPPAAPAVRSEGVERSELTWPVRTGQQFLLEIARDAGFGGARRVQTARGEHEVLDLPPGVYYARLAARYDDGVQTPFSAPVQFRIYAGVGTGSGTPLQSGSGLRIQSP